MENDFKKDVMISVSGRSNGADMAEDPVSFITEGRLYRKGKHYFVNYKESSLTGMEGTTTTLHVEDNKLSLVRTGKYPSTMVFEKDGRHMTMYRTDYGTMTIVISTRSISSTLGDSGGVVDVLYDMEIENQPAYQHHLVVSVTEKEQRRMSV